MASYLLGGNEIEGSCCASKNLEKIWRNIMEKKKIWRDIMKKKENLERYNGNKKKMWKDIMGKKIVERYYFMKKIRDEAM